MLNLKMILKGIPYSLVQLETHKMWSYVTPWFQQKKKISIKINLTMNGWKTWYIKMRDYNLYVKENERMTQSNSLKPW
jgi:hypothetical protein